MSENIDKVIRKQGVVSGILLGIIVTIVSIFSFYYLTEMVTSTALIVAGYFVLFPIIIPLGCAVFFVLRLRAKIGGYWSFKQAVGGIFIIFLVACVTQFIFKDVVFTRLVEPNIVEKTEKALINDAVLDFKRRKVSQKDIDLKVKEIQSNLDPQKHITIAQQVQGLGISIIFLFVLALIFAAFFKREVLYYNPNASKDLTV
ncbi:MAG: hypothetical protein JWR38_1088 [Mucilaginibacter sp.]|nr:hypothetical protein [Mucilaginibacter sp.]